MGRCYDEPRLGRARIRLDARTLAAYLNLPESMRVLAVIQTQDPVGMDVVVESEDLPYVEPYAESPVAHLIWTLGVTEHDTPVREFEIQWPEGATVGAEVPGA